MKELNKDIIKLGISNVGIIILHLWIVMYIY